MCSFLTFRFDKNEVILCIGLKVMSLLLTFIDNMYSRPMSHIYVLFLLTFDFVSKLSDLDCVLCFWNLFDFTHHSFDTLSVDI